VPTGIHSVPRGLAQATIETRRYVSQIGGLVLFIHKDEDFLRERAEKGGTATVTRYGREHFVKIANLRWKKARQMRGEQK
jgi:hypothetical protein